MEKKIMNSEFTLATSIVAIAISDDLKSKHVVKWALNKLIVPNTNVIFKLLHVRPKINNVPTPMGVRIGISRVREDVVDAFRNEVQWQTSKKLLPYMRICAQKKVHAEILQIESDDVVNAIVEEVARSIINKLVIGASSSNAFLRGRNMSSRISESAPKFCTVYAISNGKLSSMRSSKSEVNMNVEENLSDSTSYFAKRSSINKSSLRKETKTNHVANKSVKFKEENRISNSDQFEKHTDIDFELKKLRMELKHIQGMQAIAQIEATDASEKLKDLQKRHLDETLKFEDIRVKEEEAEELAKQEKEKHEAAKIEAERVKDHALQEYLKRKFAASKASRDAREKEKLEKALVGPTLLYQKFTVKEIETATSSFSDDLKIGMGSYGTVYKCTLHHTDAAVKVLHSNETHPTKQFHQEFEVLSKLRHPHLLILLGACPENGCLVYEYMENGSLEERLFRKNNTPPIPWYDRYRIAWEVASALIFLHHSKPKPIVHRDLKPANILLDQNLVSKIGDVGLSMMYHSHSQSASISSTVGTICYIDPEYQRSGIISPSSDVYAFGIVILQLITGKPAIAVAHIVEKAIANRTLMNVLDLEAGDWPIEETEELATMGVRCAELRRIDRPSLKDHVLPVLAKLKEVADLASTRIQRLTK